MLYSIIAAVVLLIAIFKVRGSFTRWKAAMNIVLGKYTYDLLDEQTKTKVREKVNEIATRNGWRSHDIEIKRSEASKFGCYALAMAELGIKPAAPQVANNWNFVKNPFTAINPTHKYIPQFALQLREKTIVAIEILPPIPLEKFLSSIDDKP